MRGMITASPSQLARVARIMSRCREPNRAIDRGQTTPGYLWSGTAAGISEVLGNVLVEAGLMDPAELKLYS